MSISGLDEAERLFLSGEGAQALDRLRSTSVASDPLRHAELLVAVLLYLRRYEPAAKAGKEALASGLESPRLHDLMAQALADLGLTHEARSQAARGTGGAEAILDVAWNDLYQERYEKAESEARRALALRPSFPLGNAILHGAQALRSEPGAFERLLDLWWLDRSPVTFNVMVLVAERRGRLDEIAEVVLDVRRRPKVDTQLFYWIARYYLKKVGLRRRWSPWTKRRSRFEACPGWTCTAAWRCARKSGTGKRFPSSRGRSRISRPAATNGDPIVWRCSRRASPRGPYRRSS